MVSELSCNKAIIYDLIYNIGGQLPVSYPFTFDSAAGTLSTYSNDPSIWKDYTLKLTAKFTGVEYTDIAGEASFDFNLIDPCTVAEVKVASSSSNLVEYFYTGSSPLASASVSFELDPSSCNNAMTYGCSTVNGPTGFTNLCSLTSGASNVWFTNTHPTGKTWTLETTDISAYPPGTYTIRITSTIDTGSVSKDFTVILNACKIPSYNTIIVPSDLVLDY